MTARSIALHHAYQLSDRRNGRHRSRNKIRCKGRIARRAERRETERVISEF